MAEGMRDDDPYICGHSGCYSEVDIETMREGRDYGVIVFRNGAEWMVNKYRRLPPIFTEHHEEDENQEYPTESIAYLLCRDHFVLLRAEIIANRGIADMDIRKIMEGTR
jgi:hypothetical protein